MQPNRRARHLPHLFTTQPRGEPSQPREARKTGESAGRTLGARDHGTAGILGEYPRLASLS